MDLITRTDAKRQGLRYFFTGKPCNHGHVHTRYVSNGGCVECVRGRYNAQKDNPEFRRKARKRASEWQRKNPERYAARYREWYKNNTEKINKYHRKYDREKRRTDPEYRLKYAVRHRLRMALKGDFKSGSAVRDLGCSIPELKAHLEAQFQEGMSWQNYGYHGWHVDHVIPLASFDLTDRAQLKKACHYSNLQPLWAADNFAKSAKEATT